MPNDNLKNTEKGEGCMKGLTTGCLLIIAIPVVLFSGIIALIVIDNILNSSGDKTSNNVVISSPTPYSENNKNKNQSSSAINPTPVPLPTQVPETSITYYLAVNDNVPAPENPVPVADYETIKALIRAAENKDREKYNLLLQSPSVSLVWGGGIVFIQEKKDGLVKVEIMGKSVNGDISGQTRWTSEKFIQTRQF